MQISLRKVALWMVKKTIKSAMDIFVVAGIGSIIFLTYFSFASKPEGSIFVFDTMSFWVFLFANGAIVLMPAVVVYNLSPKFKSIMYWLITVMWISYGMYVVFKVRERGYGDGDESPFLFLTATNGIITYFWLRFSERINFWPWLRNFR